MAAEHIQQEVRHRLRMYGTTPKTDMEWLCNEEHVKMKEARRSGQSIKKKKSSVKVSTQHGKIWAYTETTRILIA